MLSMVLCCRTAPCFRACECQALANRLGGGRQTTAEEVDFGRYARSRRRKPRMAADRASMKQRPGKQGRPPFDPGPNYEKEHENEVRIGALEKDGEQMLKVMEDGGMVAVLSGMEIMYTFILRGQYQCVIHKFDAEDARGKSWEMNERNRAMLKNLPSAADQLFEIIYKPGMDLMGVMMAAERGIINFLDYIGALPAEDTDFMDWNHKGGE